MRETLISLNILSTNFMEHIIQKVNFCLTEHTKPLHSEDPVNDV